MNTVIPTDREISERVAREHRRMAIDTFRLFFSDACPQFTLRHDPETRDGALRDFLRGLLACDFIYDFHGPQGVGGNDGPLDIGIAPDALPIPCVEWIISGILLQHVSGAFVPRDEGDHLFRALWKLYLVISDDYRVTSPSNGITRFAEALEEGAAMIHHSNSGLPPKSSTGS